MFCSFYLEALISRNKTKGTFGQYCLMAELDFIFLNITLWNLHSNFQVLLISLFEKWRKNDTQKDIFFQEKYKTSEVIRRPSFSFPWPLSSLNTAWEINNGKEPILVVLYFKCLDIALKKSVFLNSICNNTNSNSK